MGDCVPLAAAPTDAPHAGLATQVVYAQLLAEIVGVERVSADSQFFDDLGADSMVMTRFCARVRKRPDLPSVSIKDIYRHPTIGGLVAALTAAEAHAGLSLAAPATELPSLAGATPVGCEAPPEGEALPGARTPHTPGAPARAARRSADSARYLLCGTAQLLLLMGASLLGTLFAAQGYEWVSTGSGVIGGWARSALSGGTNSLPAGDEWMSGGVVLRAVYLRSLMFTVAGFTALSVLPIAAKWLLIGRWKPRQIRVWSLEYLRFWVIKTLIRTNPLALFVGSPIYPLYLRALGAKVGRGVAVFSRTVPVCTDLLTLGDGAIIRKDSLFSCYRAHAGMIQTGSVTIGDNALVSEASVLDINTSLGHSAQLGHASCLQSGQSIPDGQRWHGTPGRRTEADFRTVSPTRCGRTRMIAHGVMQPLKVLLVASTVLTAAAVAPARVPWLAAVVEAEPQSLVSWPFYRDALAVSSVLFVGVVLAGLLTVATIPRLLNLLLKPGRVYPLYGLHYSVHRLVARLTNIKFFVLLFGDSSAVVGYLRLLGYKLRPVEQTGSNFGCEIKHENPYVSHVGTGTMVADGLSIASADYSSSSFRVSEVFIGRHNFLGNHIAYPSGGRTGDNCLLATKVMVPIDGEVRHGVGLLGSPSFEIPRTVARDRKFDELRHGDELRRRLVAKNRHNAATMAVYLGVHWGHAVGLTVVAAALAACYRPFGALAVGPPVMAGTLFSVGYFVLVERAVQLFRPMRPLYCSIYDRRFWRHERFWKASPVTYQVIFNGTPFKNLIWRMLGVRIGRRVFDDGCIIPEKTLVTIGDDCTLNANSRIQCHSQEDGAFKSDRTQLGSGVTIGVNALVHYGVTIGDGAVLDADTFLMKGEQVTERTWWTGNPASEVGPLASAHATPAEFEPAALDAAAPTRTTEVTGPEREGTLAELAASAGPRVYSEPPEPRSPRSAGEYTEPEASTRRQPGLPLVPAQASGSFVRDVDGNVFIDFASGAAPLPLGHNHPALSATISAELERAVSGADATSWVRRAYTQADLFMLPESMRSRMRIQFGAPARSTALDAALGLCRAATGRRDVVALRGEFSLERVLHDRAGAVRIPAAVVISMTSDADGVMPTPFEVVHRARQATRELGIPLVVDEVATGAGRTGTWYAFEQYAIAPDVVVSSRAVSGLDQPVAVVLYDVSLRRWAVDAPCDRGARVALMTATRMVDIVRRDHLLRNAQARGEQLAARLGELRAHPAVLEVYGRGLMWGVELTAPGDGRSSAQLAQDVRDRTRAHGLIIQVGGPGNTVLRIQPPLTVPAHVIDTAVSALADALDEAVPARGAPLLASGRTTAGRGYE